MEARRRREVHDATQGDLHKIGPGDTPFSSFPLPVQGMAGLAGWLDSSGGVLHASSQAPRRWGTRGLGSQGTYSGNLGT